MIEMLCDNLWPTITRLARKSKRKYVAVAYFGHGANRILPLSKGDSLLVDMSIDAVKSGQTDPNEIEKYFKKGVDVYTCSNLHAKTYVFDNTLIVGSANVSQHSRINLIEAGLLCKDTDVIVQMIGWIKSLQTEPITPEYIKQCKKVYEPPKMRFSASKKKGVGIPQHSRLWILSVSPTDYSDQEKSLCRIKEKEATKRIKDPESLK